MDLMQNGLAGTPEPLGGLIQSQVAIGHVGHEPGAGLVGEPDPPGGVRGGLLAGEQSRPEPSVDGPFADTEFDGGLVDGE